LCCGVRLVAFLGLSYKTLVGVSMLLAQVSVWCAIMAVAPEDVALRIHASTVFTVVVMSLMCVGLMRDRSQPAVLRWITIAILVEYMLASVAQSILEIDRKSTRLNSSHVKISYAV